MHKTIINNIITLRPLTYHHEVNHGTKLRKVYPRWDTKRKTMGKRWHGCKASKEHP